MQGARLPVAEEHDEADHEHRRTEQGAKDDGDDRNRDPRSVIVVGIADVNSVMLVGSLVIVVVAERDIKPVFDLLLNSALQIVAVIGGTGWPGCGYASCGCRRG